MELGYAQVHAGVANQRKTVDPDRHLWQGAFGGVRAVGAVGGAFVFYVEFLLIDCSGREKCSLDSVVEPLRSGGVGIAYIFEALAFVLYSRGETIAKGYVAGYPFLR